MEVYLSSRSLYDTRDNKKLDGRYSAIYWSLVQQNVMCREEKGCLYSVESVPSQVSLWNASSPCVSRRRSWRTIVLRNVAHDLLYFFFYFWGSSTKPIGLSGALARRVKRAWVTKFFLYYITQGATTQYKKKKMGSTCVDPIAASPDQIRRAEDEP